MTLSKSAQCRKEYDDSQIATAVGFSAHIQYAPNEKDFVKTDTFAQALAAAKHMNSKSQYGRMATIYAITPEGFTVPVDYQL